MQRTEGKGFSTLTLREGFGMRANPKNQSDACNSDFMIKVY